MKLSPAGHTIENVIFFFFKILIFVSRFNSELIVMHIKIYGHCMALHTQGFWLKLSIAEILRLNLYNILHNMILIVNIVALSP